MASDLISRLESATEGSRELDVAICEALGHEVRQDLPTPGPFYSPSAFCLFPVPLYTIDIFEALSIANDANARAVILGIAADECITQGLDPVKHAPLLICVRALKARGL